MTNDTITFEGMRTHVLLYLDDVRGRIKSIKAREEDIRDADRRLGLMGVAYSDLPGGPSAYGDAVPDGVIRLMEARERYADELALHSEAVDEAYRLCRSSEAMHALWLHHVQGMNWPQVAKALAMSESTVKRRRTIGTVELYRSMPEEWRRNTPNAEI